MLGPLPAQQKHVRALRAHSTLSSFPREPREMVKLKFALTRADKVNARSASTMPGTGSKAFARSVVVCESPGGLWGEPAEEEDAWFVCWGGRGGSEGARGLLWRGSESLTSKPSSLPPAPPHS